MDNKLDQKITYFLEKGKHNSQYTLELAKHRAIELGIKHIVLASTHGYTATLASKIFKGTEIKLIAVGISESFGELGWSMTNDEVNRILKCGIKVCKSVHVLSAGIEEAFLGNKAIQNIVADTFRIFSQGTKVAIEISIMAAEAGLIPVNKEIIVIAGTDGGADTALVILPNYARKFKKIQVLEILCKPRTPFK